MKVLVTGASGHLGANLVRHILNHTRYKASAVRVLLRRDSNNAAVENLDVDKVYGDLLDKTSLSPAMKGIDEVFHCAAAVSTRRLNSDHIFKTNVIGTKNLLDTAREFSVKKIVVTSSLSTLNASDNQPFDENTFFNPFIPEVTPYGLSKTLMESQCIQTASDDLNIVIAISSAIVGPNDYKPSRLGKTLLDFSKGHLKFYIPGGFTFVTTEDICEGHILAMEKGQSSQRYIFASEFLTMETILEYYSEIANRPKSHYKLPAMPILGGAILYENLCRFLPLKEIERFTPGAIRFLQSQKKASTSKAEKILGFKPSKVKPAIEKAYVDFCQRGLL